MHIRHCLIGFLLVLLMIPMIATGCGSSLPTFHEEPIGVRYDPGADAHDVNPTATVSVTAPVGTLKDVALTNTKSKHPVAGQLSPDGKTYTTTEALGYNATYTWSGKVVDRKREAKLDASFATVAPVSITTVRTHLADGQTVGIAAPIIVEFGQQVADKAAVEKAFTVVTDPPTEGSWAWFPSGLQMHWRPKQYYQPGTKVDVSGKLYGLNFGEGAYGETDLTLHTEIGRSQIVKADARSHRMKVVRDGKVVMDFAVSYGEANEPRNTTRSGIHVVTEKYRDFMMSNPPFYTNVRERFAVRISNNGEFIHANPETTGVQGATNVTNGCINLNDADAQQYFNSAMFGDPVEVTGTSIELSERDGDLWDWAIDWPTWKSMSALP